jgi:hypothetical protein
MTSDPHKIAFLNKCRIRNAVWKSDDSDGMNGTFIIPYLQFKLGCIASDQCGWEHVSVTDQTTAKSKKTCPTWEMMCRVKRAFWDDEECVIEYHVPMIEWINEHPGCLHLWKPIGIEIPRPPALFVGLPQKI